MVVKTTLYVSIKIFSEQIFAESFFIFLIILGHWLVFSRLSGKLFRQVCHNCNLHAWRISLSKEIFSKEFKNIHCYRKMGARVLALWEILSGWVVITACCASVGILKTLDFFNVVRLSTNIFLYFVDCLSTGCRNCFLIVRRNTSGENSCFEQNIFFILFGHWAKVSWPSGKFFWTWLCLSCIVFCHKNLFRKRIFRYK